MCFSPGDPYYAEFITSNPSSGAAQNADSLPVATANHNGADDATFTLTVANLDTGRYKISGTIPVGYAQGDAVSVSVAATVNSVAGKGVVDSFVILPCVNVDYWATSPVATPNVPGVPKVDLVDVNGSAVATSSVVQIDMTQTVPTSNTAQTVGDALNAARAQGFGKWVISGTALTLYAPDGTTVVRTFTLDSSSAPTQRV